MIFSQKVLALPPIHTSLMRNAIGSQAQKCNNVKLIKNTKKRNNANNAKLIKNAIPQNAKFIKIAIMQKHK